MGTVLTCLIFYTNASCLRTPLSFPSKYANLLSMIYMVYGLRLAVVIGAIA